jgi:hypothetical protein
MAERLAVLAPDGGCYWYDPGSALCNCTTRRILARGDGPSVCPRGRRECRVAGSDVCRGERQKGEDET